nr:MAG TPA: hypothetical protein [Caudoviricetes sp.]
MPDPGFCRAWLSGGGWVWCCFGLASRVKQLGHRKVGVAEAKQR